jgi:subtilisin family serine protease
VDALGAPAEFSSRGPTWDGRIKPEACARAVGVMLARDDETGYSYGNGTSFAAPMVSGAAALVLEAHPEWTSMDALEALRETASQASSPDNVLGWGIVDASAACRYRSVTGFVRRSDTGELIPGYPVRLVMGGYQHVIETGPGGWFAFCPDTTGLFTISGAGGGGVVHGASGLLGVDGVEVGVYVDYSSSGLPPTAFPVPSEDGVWIGFDLDRQADVLLSIVSLSGGEVARIERRDLPPGAYRAPVEGAATYWDGCSEDGQPAASGLYLALLDIGGTVRVLKLALVR